MSIVYFVYAVVLAAVVIVDHYAFPSPRPPILPEARARRRSE